VSYKVRSRETPDLLQASWLKKPGKERATTNA
jgi:hypothetical protein